MWRIRRQLLADMLASLNEFIGPLALPPKSVNTGVCGLLLPKFCQWPVDHLDREFFECRANPKGIPVDKLTSRG